MTMAWGPSEYPVAVVLRAEATSEAEEDVLERASSWWTRAKGWTPGRQCWWEPLPEEPPYPSREARHEDDNPEAAYWAEVEARYSALQRSWDLLGEYENRRKCPECRGIATIRLALLAEYPGVADVVRQCETCRAQGAGRKVTPAEPVLYRASRTAYPRINVIRRSVAAYQEITDVFLSQSGAPTVREMDMDDQEALFHTLDLMGAPSLMIAEETGYAKGTISARLSKARKDEEGHAPEHRLGKKNIDKGQEGRKYLPRDPGSDFVKTRDEAACEWCTTGGAPTPGARLHPDRTAPLAAVEVERIETIPPDLSSPTWADSVLEHNGAHVVEARIRRDERARLPITGGPPRETGRRLEVATVRICDACARSALLRCLHAGPASPGLRHYKLSEDLLDRLLVPQPTKGFDASDHRYEKQLRTEGLGVLEVGETPLNIMGPM